jgi:UrcA family protein
MKIRLSLFRAAVLALAASGLGAAASAGDEYETFTMTFDLDRAALATPQGADAVYGDLKRAARRACRWPGASAVDTNAAEIDCVANVIDQVVAAAQEPRLTARHAGTYYATRARRGERERTFAATSR